MALTIKRHDPRRAKILARLLIVIALLTYIVIVGGWWIEGNR